MKVIIVFLLTLMFGFSYFVNLVGEIRVSLTDMWALSISIIWPKKRQ